MESSDVRMYECRPTLGKLEGRGFVMTAIANRGEDVLERHTHAHPYFSFVVDGEIGELVGGRSRTMTAGSLLYHAQGTRHTNDFGPRGAMRLNVEVTSPAWALDSNVREAMHRSADLSGTTAALLLRSLQRSFRDGDSISAESSVAGLLRALAVPAPGHGDDPAWLGLVWQRVQEDFRARWSLDDLARDAGVHPSHLAREYRRHFGCTVGQHVRQLRIESASRALRCSAAALTEIALESGYSDQSHFTREFKQHMGVTPSRFRKTR